MSRRVALIAAVVAVVVAFGVWQIARPRPAREAAAAAPGPNVSLAVVRRGSFETRVTAQGRVGPPAGSTAKVAFAEAGILSTVDVRVGQAVSAGTILATLDRRALTAAVDQAAADATASAGQYGNGVLPAAALSSAEAKVAVATSRLQTLERGGPGAQSDEIFAQQTLRQAQLRVASDRATVARAQALLSGGVIAAKELQAAQTQLAADLADQRSDESKAAASTIGYQAALAQARADRAAAQSDLRVAQAQSGILQAQSGAARARLAAARVAYDQGALRAPADGVVVAILKHPGEAVDPTAPVVEIGPGAADTVTLSVPSATAAEVRVGDPARVALERTGAASSHGVVTAVVPAIDPATQAATVTVAGAPAGTVPGDAVSATIVTGHLLGLIVPSSAIVEDPQTGKTIVFVRAADGTFTAHDVSVRAGDTNDTLIRGLRGGEHVATQGSYELLAPSQ